ncbi:MAG: L-iditol 2-dehydrogenase [Rhodospirillales bacterium]|jgi:NAD(P)-dependent dehydrogenase (short-subunit alcohol dehydrogenase family)|nr:L-iditol 2-dehydrogenase [Rhodospirillales bacterium]
MNRLEGKSALVTGGARGIGRAISEAFVREGADVAIADLLEDEAQALAEQLGPKAKGVRLDVSSRDSITSAVNTVEEAFGGVDILVNNAGIFDMCRLDEITEEMYRRQFDVNVAGTIFACQAVVPGMIKRGGGSIINFSSQAGRRGEAYIVLYCATKAAIVSVTQSLALELAENNIRVNGIAPGVIDTPMWEHVDSLFAKYENRPLGEKKRLVGEAVPLGRMGNPEDIADPAVFLASNEARYITAQTFNVDGGNWMS